VLTEYKKAPAVTRDRLYIETMQQIYQNVSKVMIDSRANSSLLYLPLDRILQQTVQGNPGSIVPNVNPNSGAPEVGSSTAPAPADTRSRDGQRSRDRDSR
jgi:membrane protease subunit HflK